MQDLRTGGNGRGEELIDRRAAHRCKRDVRLPEPLTRGSRADPEFWRRRNAEADDVPEVQDAAAAEGGEHNVVESRAGSGVRALNRNVIDHILIIPDCSPGGQRDMRTADSSLLDLPVDDISVSEVCSDLWRRNLTWTSASRLLLTVARARLPMSASR